MRWSGKVELIQALQDRLKGFRMWLGQAECQGCPPPQPPIELDDFPSLARRASILKPIHSFMDHGDF